MIDPNAEVPKATPAEITGTQQNLGVILKGREQYLQLPKALKLGDGLLAGIESIRPNDSGNLTERGGLFFQLPNGQIDFMEAGTPGRTFEIDATQITERSIETYVQGKFELIRDGKPLVDVICVEPPLLEQHRAYFDDLINKGVKVITGAKVALVHSHPSGNLPSPEDLAHVLYTTMFEPRKSEVIVTKDFTYFLISSEQTPDLWETDKDRKLPYQLSEEETRLENQAVQKGESALQAINDFRYKTIQGMCQKYNVGFYSLGNGANTAKRVF